MGSILLFLLFSPNIDVGSGIRTELVCSTDVFSLNYFMSLRKILKKRLQMVMFAVPDIHEILCQNFLVKITWTLPKEHIHEPS